MSLSKKLKHYFSLEKPELRANNYPLPEDKVARYTKIDFDMEHDTIMHKGSAWALEILLRIILQLESRIDKLEETIRMKNNA